jgi:exosortase/archaeosortase family protein
VSALNLRVAPSPFEGEGWGGGALVAHHDRTLTPTLCLPGRGGWTQRIACRPVHAPPLAWIALQAAALWPHGRWAWQRVTDGSDDPLGVLAVALIALLLARWHERLRPAPHLGWLAAAGALTAAATAALWWTPPLAAALLAALALAAGIAAWLPPQLPRAPLAGLAVLALPVISSLQFYAGYPLRLVTAQLSTWGLQLAGIEAERSGAAMLVRGQLVIVDAPCSGVQMVWMAYCAACAVAAFAALRDGMFLRRLPAVGALVLAGNVLRNSVLVALESRAQGLSNTAHEAIGLAVLAAVCASAIWVMKGARRDELAA